MFVHKDIMRYYLDGVNSAVSIAITLAKRTFGKA